MCSTAAVVVSLQGDELHGSIIGVGITCSTAAVVVCLQGDELHGSIMGNANVVKNLYTVSWCLLYYK
jgi:hypothetical protein